METRTPLPEYLSRPGNTQVQLAQTVGKTQGAIHQMLKAQRNIFVVEHSDGSLYLEEVKRLAGAA